MDNIAQKYNRILILLFVFAPFVAFLSVDFLNMDFDRMMQLLSYLGVFLILIFRRDNNPIRFPKFLLFYLLFILYVFYSDLYRLNRDFKIMYLFSNPLIGGFNMMFIIENLSISKDYYNKLLSMSKVILVIAVVVIFIQQVVDPGLFVNNNLSSLRLVIEENESKSRLVSIYSWIGGFITVGFGFVPVFLIVMEDSIKKKNFFYLWLMVGIIFSFLSKARWIMLNTSLVFILLYMHSRSKIKFYLKYIIIIPIAVLFTSIMLEYSGVNISNIINERILEIDNKDISQKSAGTRILALEAFNKFFWEHPFLGVGSKKYGMGGAGKQDYQLRSFLRGKSSQIHVGYVSLLYMYGLLGGGLFLSFLFLILKKLYKNAMITRIWAPFFGFLGFAVANLTLVTFSIFQMGLIIVLVADKYYNQNLKLNPSRIA